MEKVIAFPTTGGNGFEAFKLYEFTPTAGGLYETQLKNGARVESLDGKKSAHLWDGKDWDRAGRFVVLPNPRSRRQQVVLPAAYKALSLGFDVYLAESKGYGFIVDERGFVVSFGDNFGGIHLSGNYDSKRCGSGWRAEHAEMLSIDGLTADAINAVTKCGAPRWATGGEEVKLCTPEMYLKKYDSSSRFTQLKDL